MGVYGPGASPGEYPSQPERRRQPRSEVHLVAELFEASNRPLKTLLRGVAVDLSRGGAKLRFWFDAPAGTKISFRVLYEGKPSICSAVVMWRFDTIHGVEFGVRIEEWQHLEPALSERLSRTS